MAAVRKSAGRKSSSRKSSSSRRGGGNPAIDRASASLEASQKALRDLRDELTKGGSKLARDADLRDLEKTLKSAGTSFRSLGKRMLKDLEDLQKAATTGKAPAKRKSSGGKRKASTSAKKTAKRASSSAKKTAKRATSSAKKARTTAGKKAGGKKSGGSKKRSGSKKR